MDYLSSVPDVIIHHLQTFLGVGDLARIAGVSRFFNASISKHFSRLLSELRCEFSSPIQDYGKIHTQRVLIIDSWWSESASKHFLPYNLVKKIKFGLEFVAVLQYNGNLYTNMQGGEVKLLERNVEDIDCCMYGMVIMKFDRKMTWYKLNAGELIQMNLEVTEVSAFAASIYAVIGFKNGKVIAYDTDYQREVNFGFPNTSPIREIRATPKMLLILTDSLRIYSAGHITFDGLLLNVHSIRFISTGNSHSLALIQEEIFQVSEWSTEFLLKFMAENGYEDCCQIIKNHEINGSDICDLNEKFFLNTLGIREPDRRNKLKYLLKQSNSQGFSKNFSIIGWGRNNFMQLGPEGHIINSPIKILSPELVEDEKIQDLQCDKNFSYVVTSHGRLLALGGKNNVKMTKDGKKGVVWEDVSTKVLEKGKIVSVTASNKMIGILYRDIAKGKVKIKMRMAEDILRMIMNGKVPVEAYEIGYLDRFLGIIEHSLEEFLKTDIPKHRIQYFKRAGKVVWDRRTRIDIF